MANCTLPDPSSWVWVPARQCSHTRRRPRASTWSSALSCSPAGEPVKPVLEQVMTRKQGIIVLLEQTLKKVKEQVVNRFWTRFKTGSGTSCKQFMEQVWNRFWNKVETSSGTSLKQFMEQVWNCFWNKFETVYKLRSKLVLVWFKQQVTFLLLFIQK